ncbi:MAG: nucleotide exchange factor GrpE [Victivallaceae bacterium]|nr:nucleotide exchange factor GrpE [Victivallaceae bacterium]
MDEETKRNIDPSGEAVQDQPAQENPKTDPEEQKLDEEIRGIDSEIGKMKDDGDAEPEEIEVLKQKLDDIKKKKSEPADGDSGVFDGAVRRTIIQKMMDELRALIAKFKTPTPEKKLRKLEKEYLYISAEYQNFRKRTAKEMSDARAYTKADTLHPFLTIYDYLSMAKTAAESSDNIDAVRQGLKMIIDQFFKAFDDLGVTPVDAVGKKFDPEQHEAMGQTFSDTIPEGVVAQMWNCGFKLGDRLLRPAKVVVSKGPEKTEPEASGNAGPAADNNAKEMN